MSNQKQKFELFAKLQDLGFTYEEAFQLRRIEMTLHRWAELECGVEGRNPSWTIAIERDESTGKPFMRRMGPGFNGQWIDTRWKVADREAGALKRLKAIVDARNARESAAFVYKTREALPHLIPYHQTDPRGCALYLVRRDEIPSGASLESFYNRGIAVAA